MSTQITPDWTLHRLRWMWMIHLLKNTVTLLPRKRPTHPDRGAEGVTFIAAALRHGLPLFSLPLFPQLICHHLRVVQLLRGKAVEQVRKYNRPRGQHSHPSCGRAEADEIFGSIIRGPQEGAVNTGAIPNSVYQCYGDGSLLSWKTKDVADPGLDQR